MEIDSRPNGQAFGYRRTMEFRQAFKEQLHAGLAMLADCIERCPDDLWTAGEPPRTFWRVAFHAAYFTQLYLGQNEAAFEPWTGHREDVGAQVNPTADVEPYELAEETEPYSRERMLGYVAFIRSRVDAIVDALDLDTPQSGFPNYPKLGKLSHELLTLRHLQGHVGQLSERLMAQGIDTDWFSVGSAAD